MDFLASFRLLKGSAPIKLSKPIERQYSSLDQDAFTRFLFLSVDNTPWKVVQFLGVWMRFFLTTYTITFGECEKDFNGIDMVNVALDIFFFVDYMSALIYRCQWPEESTPPEGLTSKMSRLVWRNELYRPRRVWMLVLDTITLIPFEIVRIWVPFKSGLHVVAHCAPCLRVYRLFVFYGENIKNIPLRSSEILSLIAKFALLWITIVHIFNCFYYWYAIYTNSVGVKKWPYVISFDDSSPIYWYIIFFYANQIILGNIGFGDLPPTTEGERFLTLIMALVGYGMLNGYLISALSNALVQRIRRMYTLRLRISLMKSELSSRRVPDEVIEKLVKFYHSLWISRKGVGSRSEISVSLPASLWSRIHCEIYMPALNASLIFRYVDEFCKRALTGVMEVNFFMAGDVILKRSEINTQMFYVKKGTVEIMSYQDDETQIVTYGAGSVFGQIALLLSLPAKSEIHAATFCEIQIISRRKLFFVLKDYPRAKEVIFNAHKNLLLNVMADKFKPRSNVVEENVLNLNLFYKVPLRAAKIARNDICVVSTCPFVFEPDTVYSRVWDTLVALIILVIGFYYPYCATFDRMYPKAAEPLVVIFDIILFVNLYLKFSTAFKKENILFTSPREIITSQLRKPSTFVDTIAIFPIHYFIKDDSRAKPIILCLRCLELYKIHFFFKRAESSVAVRMIGWLRLIKYILYFFFIDYIVGIIYYLEACYSDPCVADSWYPNNDTSANSRSPVWASLYIAISIISGTGYGDITPKNLRDVICVIIFCLVGVLLFIYLISEFSANLSLYGEPKQIFMDLAERINAFLVTHKMLPSERIRVRQFLNLQWERNQGYEFTQRSNLFFDTPSHLLYNISQFTKSRGFENIKLFKNFSEDILCIILSKSYRKVLPPHEVVIYAGEVCSSLVVIEEGFCEVTYTGDFVTKKIVGAGQDICTVELMLGLTSLCNVRTLTHCTLLTVTKHNLFGCLKINPLAYKELEESITEIKNSPVVKEIQRTRPVRLHLTVHPSVQKSLYRFRFSVKGGGMTELRRPYLKLGLCQWIRYLLGKATILPYGKLLKVWELSRCLFAFSSGMLFPLLPYFQLQVPALSYVGFILDGTAWVDLYFRAHVCYYNKVNLLVSHPLYTFGHYIKGSFLLDFIFCFPFDRIMFRPLYNAEGLALVSTPPISFLRMLRVLQIYRIPVTITHLGVDFLSPPSLYWMLGMMVALTIIFLNFLTSCLILYCINYRADRRGNYHIEVFQKFEEHFSQLRKKFSLSDEPFTIYFVTFYWVTQTALTLGYGDITAENKELMIFVIIVITLSYLYFNYVTIVIASYLSTINMNLTIYQKRMSHLIKFLKSQNVEPLLRKHIINHFEYAWEKQKGMKAHVVFKNFSLALKNDVLLYFYEETLKNVGAFSNTDQSVFRILSHHLNEMNFRMGAGIYKTGDIISEVYIIHQGEVTLVGRNEDETLTLGPSMIFGHLDKVPRGIPQLSAVATKNVTILSIKTSDLYSLLGNIHRWTEENKEAEMDKLRDSLMRSNESKIYQEAQKLQTQPNMLYYWTFKFSKYILIFYVILSFFSINEVSYNVAFQAYSVGFAFVLVPIELLFIFKIFLGFNTGFLDEYGEIVSDRRRIRRRYMRGIGFYLDFFTVIPFEVFAFAFRKQNQLYAASLFRITKFLRARNIQYFFNMKVDTLSVNIVLLKMITVFIWTSTLLNQCTCLWYAISCYRNCDFYSDKWNATLAEEYPNRYLNSLYFIVMVLTTTGLGDLTPHDLLEFFCVDLLCCVGFFYTAIFIGQIISTVQKSFLAKTNYEYAASAMKTYLCVSGVSADTQDSVLRYMGNIWRNENAEQIPQLLKDAPPYLTNEIKQSTYGHHINNNPVFGACNAFFKKNLINELQRTVFFPGNVIVNEGEVNRTVYFVHAGLVESTKLADEHTKKVYGENTFFGLKQGVMEREPYKMTFTAITMCNILFLELRKWDFLSEFYPDDVKHIQEQTKDSKWE